MDSGDKSIAKDFRGLEIYRQARQLTKRIYELTRHPAFARDYNLNYQIRKSAVSIVSNIAEGYERNNNKEFIMFLFTAKGSCGELSAQADIALDQKYISKAEYDEIQKYCRQIGAVVHRFVQYLKNSQYAGLKHKPPETAEPRI